MRRLVFVPQNDRQETGLEYSANITKQYNFQVVACVDSREIYVLINLDSLAKEIECVRKDIESLGLVFLRQDEVSSVISSIKD